MLSSHVRDHRRYGYVTNRAFESKLIWYFTGVYIINRILHTRLWIWILSSRGQLEDKIHIHARACNIPYVINIMLFEQVCRQCSRRILTSPVIYQLKYARQQVIFQKWHPSASCHAPLGLRFRYYCKKINCFCRSLVLAFWRVRINDILGPVSRKSRKFFGPKSHS